MKWLVGVFWDYRDYNVCKPEYLPKKRVSVLEGDKAREGIKAEELRFNKY